MATLDKLDWGKSDGLLPAIVQHAVSGAILMLGYMNPEALAATQASGQVTFWSRDKRRLWMKGETSGNTLQLRSIAADCDRDALLVLAEPTGPTCHLNTPTCWGDDTPKSAAESLAFLARLEHIIADRIAKQPLSSYTVQLHAQGASRMAQKVAEEALEVALAAVCGNDHAVVSESADLLFHLLLLLNSRGQSLSAIVGELKSRHELRTRLSAP
jgi:phosphoribosyl-ATP pyrophosphohydrolase/phosphoribosyl-AMP cyclohydrolase